MATELTTLTVDPDIEGDPTKARPKKDPTATVMTEQVRPTERVIWDQQNCKLNLLHLVRSLRYLMSLCCKKSASLKVNDVKSKIFKKYTYFSSPHLASNVIMDSDT